MFWADKIAENLKKRNQPLEWVDDMKTPSGRIHVGALRGVVVHDLAYKALLDKKVKAKYTYVFENHDPMDDIPSYLPREKFEKYLGMPLFTIPSPESGFKDYAEYFALEFQQVFNSIGCTPEIIWTKDLYTSGKMNNAIRKCLDNAQEVRKIYNEMYKKKLSDNWYPFQLYCPECGKVSTTVVTSWDGKEVTYVCEEERLKWTKGCGATGKMSPFSNEKEMRGKLPWKVEWGAKWQAIGVTVEGAGKDHMSRGGSHDLAKLVCERVLHYPVPYPIPYEWFLVGGRKMSSSRGVGASAAEVLKLLPPQLLRFLMVKTDINQAINFDPSAETIPRLFDEYQEYAEHYFSNAKDDYARIFELSQIGEFQEPPKITFATLTQWVQMPNRQDNIRDVHAEEWAAYAKIWVERFAPESERFLVKTEVPHEAYSLSDQQRKYLYKIISELDQPWDVDQFQKQLYEWGKETGLSGKDAFAAIYLPLLGKTSGPRAASFILSLDKKFVKKRFQEV